MQKKYIRPSVGVVMGKLEGNFLLGTSNGMGGEGVYAPERKGREEEDEEEEW